jgi:DNA-binding response OmpR family regulator
MPVGNILIVEDSQDVRNVMAEIVAGFGYDVSEAEDGLKAMAKLSVGKYDLLITDIGMPNMGGEELVKKLRRSGNDIPVILIAGVDIHKLETDLTKLTGCRFIKKPFDIEDFKLQIQGLIRDRGKRSRTTEKARRSGPSSRKSR